MSTSSPVLCKLFVCVNLGFQSLFSRGDVIDEGHLFYMDLDILSDPI